MQKQNQGAFSLIVGEGAVVIDAVIDAGTQNGKHCIVNTSAIVECDNRVSDYIHTSVGARLGGTITVGKRTWIGISAIVANNLLICDDCTIDGGGVVVRDILEPGTYVGLPVRRIGER